ncbi:MAG: type IV pilin [Methanomicrobiales archaeon]|nr:type IV pilin [Methanomicrobiales archaeon]
MKREHAVSEIVGAILLVAIVITGIGIVTVFMTSTPPPQAKEKAVLSSSCIDCNGSYFAIVVRHEGGDTFDPKKLTYFLNTEYANKTRCETGIPVNPSRFYYAEDFSALSRDIICWKDPSNDKSIDFESIINGNKKVIMTNGDAIIIEYLIKK